jgi:Ser/Thr protein kinase RdoA (MazF antagonist)
MRGRFDLFFAEDLLAAVSRRIEASPALRVFFRGVSPQREVEKWYLEFHRQLRPALLGVRPWVSHGDWHANNLFFSDDEVSSVIDLHLADLSFRMYDLAVALDRNAILWLEILAGNSEAVRYDVVEEMVRGYASVMPLSGAEVELLTRLLPVHQLDLALSNVDYYLSIEGRPERAEWAYHTYLLDHTRYFAGPEGRRTLAALRQAVESGAGRTS